MCTASPSMITRALPDLQAWTAHCLAAPMPVLADTAELLESYRANEDAVDAHLLAETISADPLMSLKLMAHVADARARGLDFVPLVHERYHLACLKASLDQPATRALRTLLRTSDWQAHMAALPGYTPLHCGEVLAMSAVLPWWHFSGKKRIASASNKP